MALPIKLNIGMASIYGAGSVNGLFSPPDNDNNNLRFGVVNSLYSIYGGFSIGQSVMYNVKDAIPLFYENETFFILPVTKIISPENPVVET